MRKVHLILLVGLGILLNLQTHVFAADKEPLRILTWEGYVTPEELTEVNQILEDKGYAYEAQIVEPYSEGAKQMFGLIRANKVDISFLTLFFIKMENEQTSRLLQAINTQSPRLTNYKALMPTLTHLPMGLNDQKKPLYIPWGGGAYGFYIDRDKVKKEDVPTSVKDLWAPEWKNTFSLNKSQEWYNIGLSLMSLGKSPFHIYELVQEGNREQIADINERVQKRLTHLYANAGNFWKASPNFKPKLLIVSSWGPEITRENRRGSNWEMINFSEGHMAWLDTINFVKALKGKKLEAAEVFANYFIGKKVQNRVAQELSMVAASSEVPPNPVLGDPSNIFKEDMFVPPYDRITYNIMERMTEKATIEALNNKD